MGERGAVYTAGGHVNCGHPGTVQRSFKKQEIEQIKRYSLLAIYFLKTQNTNSKIYILPMFIAAYLQPPAMETTKSWLETQHSKNEDHDIQSHHFMAKRWGKKWKQSQGFFSWAPKSL